MMKGIAALRLAGAAVLSVLSGVEAVVTECSTESRRGGLDRPPRAEVGRLQSAR
jgi:hypothetical protein